MSQAKPPTEPAIASQDRAADDSERVSTHGREWLFLIVSAGVAALLAIGTSLGEYVRRQHRLGVCG